jgi:hypothetical protein
MAIEISTSTVLQRIEERTVKITIDIPAGSPPNILINRELATYQNDVLVSTEPRRTFTITVDDLLGENQLALMAVIAKTIDDISIKKKS